MDRPADGSRGRSATPTTHGMPSWRAMMAVWLVVPPRRIAMATMRAGSRPAVSAGARSSANSTDGSSGSGTPGSGTPSTSATTRSRTSCRSVTRSAITPPAAVNIAARSATARVVAVAGPAPSACLPTKVARPRSDAMAAVACRTSEAAPDAWPAREVRRSATVAAAAAKAAIVVSRSTKTSSEGASARAPGRTTGPAPTPGTTGVPVVLISLLTVTEATCSRGLFRRCA